MDLQIAVLAAGHGTRMRSALPKVLHPLGGVPLLDHVLRAARALSPRKLCIVYGAGGEQVREALDASDLVWARQEPPRGTGDALRCALEMLPDGGVTLVLIGDIPLIRAESLRALVAATQGNGLAVLTASPPDPTGLGRIVRDAEGGVSAIVEDRDCTPEQRAIGEVNTGVMAAPTAAFRRWLGRIDASNAQNEYYLTDAVAIARAEGASVHAVRAVDIDEVQGVNDRVQLAYAERVLQRREAERLMRDGVTIVDPARFDLRGTIECGRDVRIDVGCVFSGRVTLGDNVVVGPYCIVSGSTIGAGTRVEAFSHLDSCVIGSGCRIGPYARLRPQARLAEEVHIGNFVEVKASTIGNGSKANHLAYIGDTDIGRNVNVGAGTITCNYDGVNKHRTVIEDDVFIGSDTQLVAPVTVGRGATIGAGTTLTRDAPPDQLTLTRPQQVTIAGWQRPRKKS